MDLRRDQRERVHAAAAFARSRLSPGARGCETAVTIGAGAVETVACALAMRHQAVPPTANLTEPDSACDPDYVPLRGGPARVATCLDLAAGFAGSSVALVLWSPS